MANIFQDPTGYKPVFIDTNLDTHLAIPVSKVDTVLDLKRKLLAEHSKCFQEFGQIQVHALKVKRKGKFYSLSDLFTVTSLFTRTANVWLLFADISAQFCPHEDSDYNTMFLTHPKPQLHRGYEKNERIFQTDDFSGEARSENLHLVVGFRNDDNLKSSSSDTDKRLNTLVQDIYRANCGKGKTSTGLVTEVTSVNPPVNKSLDVGSLENNKPKKRNDAVEIGSTDKDSATQNLELVKKLDQNVADNTNCDNVGTAVGSTDPNKREDKSAELEQQVDPHCEGKEGLESHGVEDAPTESDKTKRITKRKNKRMAKLKEMNDDTATNINASSNVSAKSLATPLDIQFRGSDTSEAYQSPLQDKATVPDAGATERVGVEKTSMLDEVRIEELRRVESVSDAKGSVKEGTAHRITLESGIMRSKKRKNSESDVSHQMEIKGKDEVGVPDVGDVEEGTKMLAESGTTRPLKRMKTGDDFPDVIKMDGTGDEKSGMLNNEQNQTQKGKKKKRPKQTAFSKSVAENNDDLEVLTAFEEQIDKSVSVADDKSDNEMKNGQSGVDDNVLVANPGSEINPQKGAAETLDYDAEAKLQTCIQKGGKDNGVKSEKSKKKKKRKLQPLKNIADPSVTDQNDSIKLEPGKINNVSLISSSQADADISTRVEVDVNLQQEAVGTCQNDVDPIQLTQLEKSRCDTENKSAQPQKKTKQKQIRSVKSLPEAVVGHQDDSRNDVARAEVSVKAADDDSRNDVAQAKESENRFISSTFNAEGSTLVGKSVDAEHQNRLISSAEQHAPEIVKSKVASSSLKTKGRVSLLNGIVSSRVGNKNDSRSSSSHSDILNKRSHQRKVVKELPKVKLSDKSTKKVVQNPSNKNSLISKCSSIFKDESSSSSERTGGREDFNSSTENPNDDQVSSDDSQESKGSWASPKRGNSENGGFTSNSKEKLPMAMILRSTRKYKKAKLVASQLQLEDDDSQAVDVVPDSQVKT